MTVDLQFLLPILATAITGAFGFLIKSYLNMLNDRLSRISAMSARRDGQLDSLLHDLRKNNEEMHKLRYEMQAVWRYIDNSSRRATDIKGA